MLKQDNILKLSKKVSQKNCSFNNGLLLNKFQNNPINIIINKENGKALKMKKMELSPKLSGYFNSLSKYDIDQYKQMFGIDLNEEKSFSIKYIQFGSSVCMTDTNYIFSIGGVDKTQLMSYIEDTSSQSKR
jgi:hypothetical protein